ncbi:MAG: cobalamin B12-binding domain-containing protein [Candidatus Helarchaeota archaeon]|nr:cobalamin B12-binding domain-containing protein [Candidatus Helarchaeota archaeon]
MKKSKITLIVPPVEVQYTKFLTKSNLLLHVKKYPALGLGYIAAVLEKNGYPIQYIDMYGEEMNYKTLQAEMKKAPPDFVGITCDITTLIPARKVARIIHKLNPKCKIIVGGAQINIYPYETVQHKEFDVGVIGEGEYTMLELISKLEKNEELDNVKGIIFKKDNKLIKTSPRPIIENLDKLPFPARHLMPITQYCSDLNKTRLFTTILSSRGCPFNCLFCLKNDPWRGRSPKKVVDELELIKNDLGIQEFYFIDLTMTVKKDRVIEICKEIIRRKLEIIWEIQTRVDCIDKRLLNWLKRAGCTRIRFGVESGDPRILKILRKKFSTHQIEQAISWTKKAGLEVIAFFIIGCPGDTLQSINRTIDFAKKLNPDFAFFGIAIPTPGTDMLNLAIEQGIVPREIWTKFVKGKTTEIPIPRFETKEFDSEKLYKLLRKAYLSFYFRPKYFLKRLRKIKSFSELRNHMKGFRNLLLEVFSSYFM